MIREMRNKKREMLNEDTRTLLNNAHYGVLSTISEDNTPYGIPLSFAYTNEVIYFHCAPEGHKLDNIINNDNICFTVVDSVELLPAEFATRYKSAVVFGKIAVVENTEEKRTGITAILKKYSPDYFEKGLKYIDNAFDKMKVLKIEISRITGKARL